jgi:mannose-6-phosphate isomerase-like protein (cupin superfamily)
MLRLKKIHHDKRGEIFLLTGGLRGRREITVFITKKGFARGGCIHKASDEFCVVLKGGIKYFIGNKIKIIRGGQSVKVPRNTPHYFVSLDNSLVAEWGATIREKKEKHRSFRKKVDDINRKKAK